MARRISRKELKTDEIHEAAVDFGDWLEENWRTVAAAAGGIVVLALVIVAGFAVRSRSVAETERLLGEAQSLYSDASIDSFANPDDTASALTAFEEVIERSPNSNPGRVATFYKAAALKHLGRSEEAIPVLEELTASKAPDTVRGQAELLLGESYAAAGQPDQAIEYFRKLAENESALVTPEIAILSIGRIERERGNLEAARAAWQEVIDDYPQTVAASDARQLLGPQF